MVRLAFGFDELALNKIYSLYYDFNSASGRIKEGELVDEKVKNGVVVSSIHYRFVKREYDALRGGEAR